jgi:hypothetical protein
MGGASEGDLSRVKDYLQGTRDPRRAECGNVRRKLAGVIAVAFAAVHGREDCEWMEERGCLMRGFFRSFLGSPHGAPDESAFLRGQRRLNPHELEEGLVEKIAGKTTRE